MLCFSQIILCFNYASSHPASQQQLVVTGGRFLRANDSDVIINGYFPIRVEPNERSAPEQGSALLENMADRSQKFLRDVRKCPGNDRCADCNRQGELVICRTGAHSSGIC